MVKINPRKTNIISGILVIIAVVITAAGLIMNMFEDSPDESNQEIGRVLGFAADSLMYLDGTSSGSSVTSHVRLIDEGSLMAVLEKRADEDGKAYFRALSTFFSILGSELAEDPDRFIKDEHNRLNEAGILLNQIADKVYVDNLDVETEVTHLNTRFQILE